MSFTVKGTQYRVSTPDIESVEEFPFIFRWTTLPNKTIAISRVIVTLINPVEEGEVELVFSVSTTRENFSRVFRSIGDFLKSCDQVETQIIVKKSVSKFFFEISPPLTLENKSDRIELNMKKKPSLAEDFYTMCEGWMNDAEEVTVRDIIRPTVRVEEGAPVSEAVKLMVKEKVGYMLVGKGKDTPLGLAVGIVTDADLVEKVLNAGRNPKEVRVEEIMSTPLVTVNSQTLVDDAIEIMIKKNISRLPVEEKGKIIGMVVDRDIVRAVPVYFRGASKKRIFFSE